MHAQRTHIDSLFQIFPSHSIKHITLYRSTLRYGRPFFCWLPWDFKLFHFGQRHHWPCVKRPEFKAALQCHTLWIKQCLLRIYGILYNSYILSDITILHIGKEIVFILIAIFYVINLSLYPTILSYFLWIVRCKLVQLLSHNSDCISQNCEFTFHSSEFIILNSEFILYNCEKKYIIWNRVKIVILWNIITIRIYTINQKFLNSKIFYSSVHQACIYLIPNTAK